MNLNSRLALIAPVLWIVTVAFGYGQPVGFNPDPSAVRAGSYELDPAHSRITWTTSHTSGLSHYSGLFVRLTGRLTIDPQKPESATLDAKVTLNQGGTFDPALDERLHKDFFDVAQHPVATFTSTRIERLGERQARISGDLTLHGVTRSVALTGTFNTAGVHPVSKRYTLGFDGETSIKRSEFGIAAFPTIGDEVRLMIEAEFRGMEPG